jgi:hypothetical protein
VSQVWGSQWADAARAQRQELQQAMGQSDALLQQHRQRRNEAAGHATQALADLTSTLLPDLTAESVQRAAALAGYPPLVAADYERQMAAERDALTAELARLEADPRFVNREFLRDPRGGKLVLELAEISEAQRAVREVFYKCSHPRMWALVDAKYGTPDYAVPFWRLSYYEDWKAADEILESWPGKTFAQVREEFLTAQHADGALTARIDDIKKEISAGEAVEIAQRSARTRLLSIHDRYLASARGQLGRHVIDAGAAAIGPRFASDPNLDILAKRLFGLAAKVTYLDRIEESQLAPIRNDIAAGIAKADQEIMKYSRPKKARMLFDGDAYQRRFQSRIPRYQKGWQRFQRSSDTVYVFDRYDRGSWASDFLWWDLMTDGRLDGDFIPEVAHHHQAYPGYTYDRHRWDDEPVAPFDPDPEPLAGGSSLGSFDPS